MNKAIIVIPTYNEALNVEKMIRRIFDDIFKDKEISILTVDSASPDGTCEVIEKLQKEYPNLHLLKQETKKGLASAYLEGFHWCLENGYEIMVQMDCDFQHPPELLPEGINKLNDCDLVIASRYIKDGNWQERGTKNPLKRWISQLGNAYTAFVLHCPVSDMTGGYNFWSKKALNAVELDTIMSKGYLFQIEMKYRAYKNGLKIKEVPFIFGKRTAGKSKISIKIIFEAFTLIWKIRKYKKS